MMYQKVSFQLLHFEILPLKPESTKSYGYTKTKTLNSAHNRGIMWWDEWDIGDGTIGQRYGATVKKWVY
jgi:thymidylate synthase